MCCAMTNTKSKRKKQKRGRPFCKYSVREFIKNFIDELPSGTTFTLEDLVKGIQQYGLVKKYKSLKCNVCDRVKHHFVGTVVTKISKGIYQKL